MLDSIKGDSDALSQTIDFIKTLKNIQEYGIETNNESSITLTQNANS